MTNNARTNRPADEPTEHLSILYRLPDGTQVKHLFHYLSTRDGITIWQIDPANEPIDLDKATVVCMDWEED